MKRMFLLFAVFALCAAPLLAKPPDEGQAPLSYTAVYSSVDKSINPGVAFTLRHVRAVPYLGDCDFVSVAVAIDGSQASLGFGLSKPINLGPDIVLSVLAGVSVTANRPAGLFVGLSGAIR